MATTALLSVFFSQKKNNDNFINSTFVLLNQLCLFFSNKIMTYYHFLKGP